MNRTKISLLPWITLISITTTTVSNATSFYNYNLLEDEYTKDLFELDNSLKLEELNKDLNNVKIKDFNCSTEMNKVLSKIEFLLENYADTKDIIFLDKAIELFGEVGSVSKETDLIQFEGAETTVSIFFNQIIESIYKIEYESTSNDYLVNLAKEILFGWRKNKISTLYPDRYLVFHIVENNQVKSEIVQQELNKLRKSYYYLINIGEEDTDSEVLPDIDDIIPDNEDDGVPSKPEYDGVVNEGRDEYEDKDEIPEVKGEEDEVIDNDIITINSSYEKRGKACYLVEKKYKNGNFIGKTESKVPKEDNVYCGIYDDIFSSVSNNIIPVVKVDRDYIQSNQNEGSNKYLFYTVTKNDILPYYYNSGILADSENSSVTYNQLKDVLYQISIKLDDSHYISSNSKSLTIIDGVPIVLDSEKDIYSKKETEELLNSFKTIALRIEEKIDNINTELKELIESDDYATLKYKNDEYILNNIYIENSTIIASVQEVVGYFGYKTDIDDDKMVIKNGNNKIEIYLNSKSYLLNDEEGEFSTSVLSKEDGWYCDLSKIVELIGYNLEWNSEDMYFEVIEQQ